ncbi:hypothetical protein DPMN_187434 [Dreissena polymorpha]|uniref:Uncharacterized protein n=1 Tax=Dreissena polymorpha TaxID=45954 RepID=A0A9D4DPQ7_DREPO|nr:hypothetical protein DPMN_187434 [Dreissena polymorpha]
MQRTPQNHHAYISIGGRPIFTLRFVNNIDLQGSISGKLRDSMKEQVHIYWTSERRLGRSRLTPIPTSVYASP